MYFKKRTKGVITVFLLITFSVSFVFAGLLVDGGRVKLAKTLGEASLDNAAVSALSYYDDLLVDLYGMFAMNEADAGAIEKRMERYFKETLALVPGDHTELQNILMNGLRDSGYMNPYDFEVKITSAGSSLNLGQTNIVKSQVLDHMRYRAPLQLIDSEYGFLKNVQAILQIKDRLSAAKDKLAVTKQHKSTVQEGSDIIAAINAWGEDCKRYLGAPANLTGNYPGAEQYETYIENDYFKNRLFQEFEDDIKVIFEEYKELRTQKEAAEEELAALTDEAEISAKQTEIDNLDLQMTEKENEIKPKITELKENMDLIKTNAKALKESAGDLIERIEAYVEGMENYVSDLENKMKTGNEEYKTVFEPEIELAKASAGEVILNKGVLTSALKYLNMTASDTDFYYRIEQKIHTIFEQEDRWPTHSLRDTICNQAYLTSELYPKLESLSDSCQDYSEVQNQEVTRGQIKPNTDSVKDTVQKDANNKAVMKAFTAAMLSGAIDHNRVEISDGDRDGAYKFPDEYTSDASEEVMEKGLGILDSLLNLLENGRDNLYINEYIMANCRNYVHHYSMEPEKSGKTEGTTRKTEYDVIVADKFLEKEYQDKQYTVAEIEYIIGGQYDSYANLGFVSGEILLIRSAFNMAAIFTDTAKYQQASAMCSWTGPFAPLAVFALLVAWAVAESVIDVANILQGEKVLLFKNGKDWELSVEGMFSKAVEYGVGLAIEGITSAAEAWVATQWNNFDTKIEAAIYDYSTNVTDQITGDMLENVNEDARAIMQKRLDELNQAINNSANQSKDEVIEQISKGYQKGKKETINKLKAKAGSLVDFSLESPSASGGENGLQVKLGYGDYLRILLLLENETTKLERLQEVIQVNMRQQSNRSEFQMCQSYVNVYAEAKCSINYVFMSQMFVPADIRLNGRHEFNIMTNRTY